MSKISDLYSVGNEIRLSEFSDFIGEHDDRFKILSITEGGMGGCVKIADTANKHYALKMIFPENVTDNINYGRYINELSNWITFSSCDGVLDAYKIIKLNDLPCVVSPWMQQGALYSLMKIKERTVFYNSMHRIIGTLKWVYDNYRTIHRDLKPDNILVDTNYLPYVGDWGLSKHIEKKENKNSTTDNNNLGIKTVNGVFLGTYPYSSPEQLIDSSSIDAQSDIFALGVIMYEWITGELPFKGSSKYELTDNIIHGRFQKFDRYYNPLNFGIEDIINKCLETNLKDRFQNYDELLLAIEESAKDVAGFVKYEPQVKSYKDILHPQKISERIQSEKIKGVKSDKYILVDEKNILEQIEIANNLSSLKKYDEALKILLSAVPEPSLLTQFPDLGIHHLVISNIGYVLHELGRYEEAVKWLELIKEGKNLSTIYYLNLSNSLLALGRYSESLQVSQCGIEKDRNETDLLGNACLAATALKDFELALQYANNRIKCDPCLRSFYEYSTLLLDYGDSIKETDFPKAIKMYRSSLLYLRKAGEYNARNYDVKCNEAIVLFKLRRYTDSLKVLNTLDAYELTIYWIAKNLLWSSASSECLSFCDRFIERFPNSTLIKRVRSECMVDFFVIGNSSEQGLSIEDSTWRFFSNIINDDQHSTASDFVYFGRLLNWVCNKDVLEYFDWAKTKHTKEWRLYFHKSNILLHSGIYEEALQECLEARRLAPWREKVYELLAQCYKKVGDESNAQKCIEKSNEIKTEKNRLYESCKNL